MKIGINANIVGPVRLVDLDFGEVFSTDDSGDLYMRIGQIDMKTEKPFTTGPEIAHNNCVNLATGIVWDIDPNMIVVHHKTVALTASIYEYFGGTVGFGGPVNATTDSN